MTEFVQEIKHIIIMATNKHNDDNHFRSLRTQSLNQSRVDVTKHVRKKGVSFERNLNNMIKMSTKTDEVSNFLKKQLFHLQNESQEQKMQKKQMKRFVRHQTISHVEHCHEKFFVPTLQAIPKQVKGSTIQAIRSSMDQSQINFISLSQTSQHQFSPLSSLKITRYQNIQKIKSKSQKHVTNPSHDSDLSALKKRNRLMTSIFKSQIRKSNTFLFNLPSKLSLKKKMSPINQEIEYMWEEGLMKMMNRVQGSDTKAKHNTRVERDKFSQYLKNYFINEVITTYYKCDQHISFSFMKQIVTDLLRLPKKESLLLTFFTYDLNNDGYICEEDIFVFLQKLNSNEKIMQDFNLIVQFLRKNKVRSTETNLPKRLLLKKQKTIANQLWNQGVTVNIKSIRQKHKNKLAKQYFSLLKDTEDEGKEATLAPFYKKFQINFDVFCLIYAQKRPVLILEIIRRLIEQGRPEYEQNNCVNAKTEPSDQFLYTRSQEWKMQMQKSEDLLSLAHQVRNTLTYNIKK